MKRKSIVSSTTIASSIRKLSLSLFLLGCLSSLNGIQAQEVKISDTIVDEDEVTLRIKVKDPNKRPVSNLKFENFQVFVDGESKPVKIDPRNWKNPQQTKSPSAWIIVLLDMSGSMKYLDGGNPDINKLQGAVNAIGEFSNAAASRSSETNISIVPFAESDPKACPKGGYTVDTDTLDNFYLAGSEELKQELQKYEEISQKTDENSRNPQLCGYTNLYKPLINAVEFLDNSSEERFYPPEESDQQLEPRRSIILLSDGFHNGGNDDSYSERLEQLLGTNEDIIVHSLGYGLKPTQLGAKYQLKDDNGDIRSATREDIEPFGKVKDYEFVDVNTLDGIAKLTQGFCDVSMDAKEVANILKNFLDDLLGAYEITYIDPNPERGSIHSAEVEVNSRHFETEVSSEPKSYRITVFGRKAPWLPWRLSMLGGTLAVLGLGCFLPFKILGELLKKKE